MIDIEKLLVRFCNDYRNYRDYDVEHGIVEKTFNHGRGALPFIKVYTRERTLAVNRCFYNHTDERKIADLKKRLSERLEGNWRIVWCEYGYPAYYNHDFGLKYAVNK